MNSLELLLATPLSTMNDIVVGGIFGGALTCGGEEMVSAGKI